MSEILIKGTGPSVWETHALEAVQTFSLCVLAVVRKRACCASLRLSFPAEFGLLYVTEVLVKMSSPPLASPSSSERRCFSNACQLIAWWLKGRRAKPALVGPRLTMLLTTWRALCKYVAFDGHTVQSTSQNQPHFCLVAKWFIETLAVFWMAG